MDNDSMPVDRFFASHTATDRWSEEYQRKRRLDKEAAEDRVRQVRMTFRPRHITAKKGVAE